MLGFCSPEAKLAEVLGLTSIVPETTTVLLQLPAPADSSSYTYEVGFNIAAEVETVPDIS